MDLALSNLALHHLIDENQIILNGFINKVQTTPMGFLKLKIHTKEGDKNLIATQNAIFLTKQTFCHSNIIILHTKTTIISIFLNIY